jgi:hypothetical protein
MLRNSLVCINLLIYYILIFTTEEKIKNLEKMLDDEKKQGKELQNTYTV